jgi:hypothetical protein
MRIFGRLRAKCSPGLGLAAIALLIALGGTATAAGVMTVTSKQIKNGTIQLVDINKRAKKKLRGQRGPKGAQGNQGISAQGLQGPVGPQGAPGPAGPEGAQGPAGPAGTQGPAGPAGADGVSPILGRINALGLTGEFGAVSGTAGASATESDVTQLSPGAAIVARDLAVELTTAPGAGASRTFTLRDDGVPTSVSCTIAGTQTSCTSGSSSASIAAGSRLSIQVSVSSLPAPASALFGWRATST